MATVTAATTDHPTLFTLEVTDGGRIRRHMRNMSCEDLQAVEDACYKALEAIGAIARICEEHEDWKNLTSGDERRPDDQMAYIENIWAEEVVE